MKWYQDSNAFFVCFEHIDIKWYHLLPMTLEFERLVNYLVLLVLISTETGNQKLLHLYTKFQLILKNSSLIIAHLSIEQLCAHIREVTNFSESAVFFSGFSLDSYDSKYLYLCN